MVKKLRPRDGEAPSTFSQKHGGLVQTCAQQNEVSKCVEKLLERQFEPYGKLVEGVEQKDICRFIEGEKGTNGLKNVPLQALIWFAVRNQREDIAEIESRVFNAIHMQGHQSLRLYDALSRELPDGKVENVLGELRMALKSKEGLQKRYKRSEQKREQLKLRVETIKKDKSQVALSLAEQRQLNGWLRKDLEKLGGQSALDQIESLKKEIELLNQEIGTLTGELLNQELYGVSSISDEPAVYQGDDVETKAVAVADINEEQEVSLSLVGKKVAFVGD